MIITLCGSNRFEEYFKIWNEILSLAGHVVFTTTAYPSFKQGIKDWYTDEEKEVLDLIHLRKVEASDAVLLLNVFGYIGSSTMREISYAKMLDKKLYTLESWGQGCGVGYMHQDWLQKLKESYDLDDAYVSPLDTTSSAGFDNVYDLLNRSFINRALLLDKLNRFTHKQKERGEALL